jgi:hypothetical protein
MTEYNGHPSWNAWNVSLWIGNDETLYRCAVEALRTTHTLKHATNVFFGLTGVKGCKTPDGGVFNPTAVKLALAGLEIEQPKREY